MIRSGTVYLIGAGPGDPGLITVTGLKVLRRAQVVVYDQLVSESLLEYVSPSAEKIFVGKAAGKHAAEQDEINKLIAAKARQGKVVARLKGGDPFVFGRGGEEARFLRDREIPFQIVPGVTSAVAVPAYAGIPVTHRGVSSSFSVVTGHEDPAKGKSSIHWSSLAAGGDTLVFLMGMEHLAAIVKKLVKSGLTPSTPIAVIQHGTLATQVTVSGTLEDIVNKVDESGVSAPAVIVIGDVVRLRDELCWYDSLPLFGKRILITRPAGQARVFEEALRERGALPCVLPLIEIKPVSHNTGLQDAARHVGEYDWVVFTSANGVEAFWQELSSTGWDARALASNKIGAIGPATAACLKARGIEPDYVPDVYTGERLAKGMGEHSVRGKKVLLPRADIANEKIGDDLTRAGAIVSEVVAYRTVRPRGVSGQLRSILQGDAVDMIAFTSASTVMSFVKALDHRTLTGLEAAVACIGPRTSEAAVRAGLSVSVQARVQTIEGLVDAIETYYRRCRCQSSRK